MSKIITKACALGVIGTFGFAEIGAAFVAQHQLCPNPDHQLCGENHGHHEIRAFALFNSTASISCSHVFVSEATVEAMATPPPSPLSGDGVSLVVEPIQPPDQSPADARRQVTLLWRSE